jgi:hypothetical protein
VHETLICASSPFCDRAVHGLWKESQSHSIRLDDVDASTFAIYVSWLYRAELPVRIDAPGLEGNAEYLAVARAYVLGDRLRDVAFCDACVDAMIVKAQTKATDGLVWHPVGPVIAYIYNNTMPNSKARKLLVDIYTVSGHSEWLVKWADKDTDLPSDFLFDLTVALMDAKRASHIKRLFEQPCEYHEHKEEKSCYRKLLGSSKPPSQDVVNDPPRLGLGLGLY